MGATKKKEPRGFACMVCEKRHAEIEGAEECERRHDLRPGPDDDPRIQRAKHKTLSDPSAETPEREKTGGPCCAHSRISYRTEEFVYDGPDVPSPGGLYPPLRSGHRMTRGWWECDSGCGMRFAPEADLTRLRAQLAQLEAEKARWHHWSGGRMPDDPIIRDYNEMIVAERNALAQVEQLRAQLAEKDEWIAQLQSRLSKTSAEKIVAQHGRALELMSRGSAVVELENKLREQLALAEIRAEDAEAKLAQLEAQHATLTAELRKAHSVLESCNATIDPERYPEVADEICAVLGPCDEAGTCPP